MNRTDNEVMKTEIYPLNNRMDLLERKVCRKKLNTRNSTENGFQNED